METNFCLCCQIHNFAFASSMGIARSIIIHWLSTISLIQHITGTRLPHKVQSYNCTDGEKVDNFQICNGDNDCKDHSDETNCLPYYKFNGHFSVEGVSKEDL